MNVSASVLPAGLFATRQIPHQVTPILQFTLQQHITHGPFILAKKLQHLPSRWGLAAIDTQMMVSFDTEKVLQQMGINPIHVNTNQIFVTFFGRYFQYLNLGGIKIRFPVSHRALQIADVISNIWVYPSSKRMQGDIQIGHSILQVDTNDLLTLSPIKIQFDQTADEQGLLIGNHALEFSDIILHQNKLDSFVISGVKLQSSMTELSGLISGNYILEIKKIIIMGDAFGPIHLQLSATELMQKTLLI